MIVAVRPESTRVLEPGARIGRKLEVLRRLGEGGMGTLWVARNLTTEAEVAIKVLRSQRAEDADLHAALHREIFEEFSVTVDILGFIAMYTYRDRAHHVFLTRPHSVDFIVDQKEILGTVWLSLAEVTEWYTRGLLHTGFELPAIRSSLTRFGKVIAPPAFPNGQTASER